MHENGAFPEFWFDFPDLNAPNGECNNYVIWNYDANICIRGQRSRTASYGAVTANFPIAAGLDNNVYQHEDGYLDNGASRVGTVWAETSVLNFGEGQDNFDVVQAMVSSSAAAASNNYQLKFLTRYTPGQTETIFGPYQPRLDGYMDCRATGRDYRMRIEATNDQYWSLGQIRLDIVGNSGRR